MVNIELRPIEREDVETVWRMQVEAFSGLLEKYQDYDMSSAAESMDKVLARFNTDFYQPLSVIIEKYPDKIILANPGTIIAGKGDKVQLVGFGTFEVAERAAREGKNPQTGEVIKIKASKAPKFKAGKALKDALN